ncbi:MAG: hypothetical protein QNJ34_12330 [Xenococcaceae cyanobacterium MO_188.B29]|nr:hypothetical protein [Xenococcaceae cyanobacterium MO_188.B29]
MTKLIDFSQKISELWTDTADSAVEGINAVTNYSSDRLSDITEKAKISLETSLNQADNFSSYLINNMQTRFNSLLNDWFAEHPLILWLYQHPIITLVTTFVVAVILWRLLAAIALLITTAIDKVWLWLFRSPVLFFKSLLGIEEKAPVEQEKLEITINPDQFKQIINQLNQITAQQKLIIEEINTLKQNQEIAKPNLLFVDKTKQSKAKSKGEWQFIPTSKLLKLPHSNSEDKLT